MPEPFDPTAVKLGKKLGVVEDPRTFHMRTLLSPDIPSTPTHWRYAHELREVPMFANDRYGDCTFARSGHRIVAQEFSTRQREIRLTDDDVLAGYSAVTGFDPARPETDNGAYMLDVENYLRRTGLGYEKDGSRHTIEAFVKVDERNHQEVATACNLFGGVAVGVWLPRSAQSQTGPETMWDIPAGQGLSGAYEPGSWGGHAIEVIGYNRTGLQAYTWGREQFLSWAFWDAYVDEVYAEISEDWFRVGGTTPRGFRMEQLRVWLAAL